MNTQLLRRYLLHSTGLASTTHDAVTLLERLGCIQLDPIDRYGTSAELVAWARLPTPVPLYTDLANRGFEHFAKERCILSPRFFSWYRGRAVQTAWWRNDERLGKFPESLLGEVLAEVREKGAVRPEQLEERGRVAAMDWSGWKGTGKRATLALEALWTRCDVVVAARDAQGRRLYDLPERALPKEAFTEKSGNFAEEMVMERVRSAGLLSTAGGAHWSALRDHRTDGTVETLEKQGRIRKITVGRRCYLALPAVQDPLPELSDQELRVIAPLDPLIWDRGLVRDLFDFDYVWEIYKPESQRRWGYYVCPLLRGERLVGRMEARRDGGVLRLTGLWWEALVTAEDRKALDPCLLRLAQANGCHDVEYAIPRA